MSKKSYARLVEAGAPELEDGFFYRVTAPGRNPYKPYWSVEVRRRVLHVFSYHYGNARTYVSFDPNNVKYEGRTMLEILVAATRMLADITDKEFADEKRDRARREWVGDHP